MKATSVSLLDRLKGNAPDPVDWARLHQVYEPLIQGWLRRFPGLEGESADLSQEIFVVVLKELPGFERQREGSFRTWLKMVTVNRVRSHWKRTRRDPVSGNEAAARILEELADPSSELSRQWDQEHDRHVFEKLLEAVRGDFAPATWEAFERFAVRAEPARLVAANLGMTENAVIQAKSRVLRRLREEAGDFLS